MKFKSKFGINEIVELNHYKGKKLLSSKFLKVIAILFADHDESYLCENPDDLHRTWFLAKDLNGDDNFNQEKGCYPADDDE